MVYILQIYNKCTTFPNQIVITIISGAKFFAKKSCKSKQIIVDMLLT